jgi:ABC-2 type transporter
MLFLQGISNKIPPCKDGVNPATWMLNISAPGWEQRLGIDFAKHYEESGLHKCVRSPATVVAHVTCAPCNAVHPTSSCVCLGDVCRMSSMITTPMSIVLRCIRERVALYFSLFFIELHLCRRNLALIEELSVPPEGSTPLHFDEQFAQPRWSQFVLLLRRNFRSYWRTPEYNGTRFFSTAVIALMIGSIFWQIGTTTCVAPQPCLSVFLLDRFATLHADNRVRACVRVAQALYSWVILLAVCFDPGRLLL